MSNDELVDKVIRYCDLSFPTPNPEDSEEVRKHKQNKNHSVYILTSLFNDFQNVDIRDILLEMMSNIVAYKQTGDKSKDYYGMDIEDCDDYLKVLIAVSRFIYSLEYKEKKDE